MITRMGILTRRPDLTPEQFRRHWLEVHGPLAARLPGLRRYQQNHVVDASQLAIDHARGAWEVDGFSQLWFDDIDAMRRAVESPEFRPDLPDFANFCGEVKLVVCQPNVVVPVAADAGPLVKRMSILDAAARHHGGALPRRVVRLPRRGGAEVPEPGRLHPEPGDRPRRGRSDELGSLRAGADRRRRRALVPVRGRRADGLQLARRRGVPAARAGLHRHDHDVSGRDARDRLKTRLTSGPSRAVAATNTTVALPILRVLFIMIDLPLVAAAYVYSGQLGLGLRVKMAADINLRGKRNCSASITAAFSASDVSVAPRLGVRVARATRR